MTIERHFDAVVIGGGPAGSTTALLLAQRGWRVAVIEKSAFPRAKVCGEFMSATNLPVLERLGIGEVWRTEAGPPIRRVGFFSNDTIVDAPIPGASRGAFGRALGRDALDQLLLERACASGAEVFQPWRAVGIDKRGDAQAVLVDSGEGSGELIAPVIVAAHGSWEAGRLPSQLEKSNRPGDLLGFKAHFSGGTLPADLMPLIVFPGGYGGMVWSDRGRLSLSCCIRRDALSELRALYGNAGAAEALHRHLLESVRGVREAIGDASLDGRWLAAGPIRPGIRSAYADGIFRAGNIAGESHPIIAEGITMAIQSGWLLAGALARTQPRDHATHVDAGARYEREWRRLFRTRVHSAALFASIALSPLSRAGMRAFVRASPQLLTLGAGFSGKTKAIALSAARPNN
jgi:menaquinone-9 beta-reductase